METILSPDRQFFFFINQTLRNPFFDYLMPSMRNPSFWIPLYVLLAGYLIYAYGLRSIIILLSAGFTVLITDQISSSLIKPAVQRLRPCNDPHILQQVHLLVTCGSGFSFVSSHAANHFGIAVFVIFILRRRFRWITPVALLWAALISFAQIYVGLHYPLDVLCGALLGVAAGLTTWLLCKRILKKSGAELL